MKINFPTLLPFLSNLCCLCGLLFFTTHSPCRSQKNPYLYSKIYALINIDIYEYLIFIFWFFVFGTILYFYGTYWKNELSSYLFPGFILKVLGGFAFVMVYNYYYFQGDTTSYYLGTAKLASILSQDPLLYFNLIFSESEEAMSILFQKGIYIQFATTSEEWFMLKIASPFSFLGFQTFLGTTLFMSIISLVGSWFLFSTMYQIFPQHKRFLFFINFMFPTVLFWGSGIMKDTVTLACFSIGIALFYRVLHFQKNKFRNVILMVILFYIIYQLKAYITIAFLLWALITLFIYTYKSLQSAFLRILTVPVLLGIFGLIGVFGFESVVEQSEKYQTDKIIHRMEGFHSWHKQLGGSAYDLHITDYTPLGLLKKFPEAVNVSLFRPYLWESHNAFMLLNALESLFLFAFTVFVLWKVKSKFFKYLGSDPFLVGALVFVLFFSFAIGLSSYNFGALVRFKIPLLALYLFLLFYVYQKHLTYKNEQAS